MSPPFSQRPSLLTSTAVVTLLALVWGYLRLSFFDEILMPLTFVLPLLVCVWTRRLWQLWTMAALFAFKALAKVWWVMPASGLTRHQELAYAGSTLINILAGALAVHAILALRDHLDRRNGIILAQNAELEAQAEELSQQNEEIKAQSEELAEQNEEIEAQNEEVNRQNEELVDLNSRLSGREDILEGLMRSVRQHATVGEMLDELCRRALAAIGSPAASVAFLRQEGSDLLLRSQARTEGFPALPETWPLEGSICGVVLKEARTSYVSDLQQRPDLAQPIGTDGGVRSILATPLSRSSGSAGFLLACSPDASHWTEEQFRIIEWIAAQGGLMMETLRSQKALEAHAAALDAAHRAKDRFLAMLSHELRTPLTPVLAAAGALEADERLPADVRNDLRMMRHNVGVQSRLIDDLLDLTRISRGKIELDRQEFPAGQLLRDAVRIVIGEINAREQSVEVDIDGIENCTIAGDGPRLQQVFWNLLKNASKFSDVGASIHIKARLDNAHIIVEVRDEGDGLSPEDSERIFLPFEQAREHRRPGNEQGLGLGLAISKAIVELHDGSISAQSEGRAKGSTFTVKVPCLERQTVLDPDDSATRLPLSVEREFPGRILLVEDHRDTGKIFARLLERQGFEVEHASSASEAWDLFQNEEFDVVVSDIGLPEENGIELMRRMRQLRPETRGVAISGYGMEHDVDSCRAAGFSEHLTKPVEFARLHAAVDRLLDRSEDSSRTALDPTD